MANLYLKFRKLDIYKIEKNELQEEGKEGRIVVTDLFSHAMPLINYDTGDLGIVKTINISGESKKVLETITGRLVEQLLDVNNEKVSPFAINVYLKDFDKLGQFQFIQHDRAKYELLTTNHLDSEYKGNLLFGLYNILGKNAEIIVTYREEIPSLSSGKRPYIINNYVKE